MAVLTHLSAADIAAVLAPHGWRLLSARPASEGIENSNYLLRCEDGDGRPLGLVLTLLEHQSPSAAHWFADMLARLARHGLPVPAPVVAPFLLQERPALLSPWLPGAHVAAPAPDHCRQIGAFLAALHAVTPPADPPQSERAMLHALAAGLARLPAPWRARAEAVLARWDAVAPSPGTLLHADLFRDNALFEQDRLSGVLDFYHACIDRPAYDLAVALNDWCVQADGSADEARQRALLDGYGTLPEAERRLLPLALAVAALRFWLSRLLATGPARKDPEVFARIFRRRWERLAADASQ